MPRTKKGSWLKADALRQGIPEQAARTVRGIRHTVSIYWHFEHGFVTRHRVDDPLADFIESEEWVCGGDLNAARKHFKREAAAVARLS